MNDIKTITQPLPSVERVMAHVEALSAVAMLAEYATRDDESWTAYVEWLRSEVEAKDGDTEAVDMVAAAGVEDAREHIEFVNMMVAGYLGTAASLAMRERAAKAGGDT